MSLPVLGTGTVMPHLVDDSLDDDNLDDDSNLIEPEGLNASSAEQVNEPDHPPAAGEVLHGGHGDRAPGEPSGADDLDLTGTTPSDERGPGFTDEESGQDSGLMQ